MLVGDHAAVTVGQRHRGRECQLGIRRDADRSTISWFASLPAECRHVLPNAAATAVRSPSRDAATAMFTTPPGQDPIPGR